MDGLAGFGSPPWLPLSVRRAQAAEERTEAQQARAAERALAERAEARRSADLAMIASEAEDRGERLDPVELATGSVTGHSLADALKSAQARWERDDARAEIEARKRGEPLAFVGALEDPATRSGPAMTATRRAIEKASERFTAAVAAGREAERRRGELEQVMPQLAAPHWSAGRGRHTSSRAQGSRASSLGTDYFGRPISRQRWSYR
jgi:hypothetical protein